MSVDHALFGPGVALEVDQPRDITGPLSGADRIFRWVLRGAGASVLALTGLIGVFLLIEAKDALGRAKFSFLTTQSFNPAQQHFGIASLLPNGTIIAAIALFIAIPVGLGTALFIAEYASAGLRRPLIAMVDLMAAIPSIIYALWGVTFLAPRVIGTSRWMSEHLDFIPLFHVRGEHTDSSYLTSPFIAGTVVSLIVIPLIASISREVFSRAPIGEREAAYALGSSKWGMIRSVVLPYGKGGMIGAVMLGFGRAMGETIIILLILSPSDSVSFRILEPRGSSIASKIGLTYSESTHDLLSALMAAGLVLFVVTLAINALAAIVVGRSRSGADG